MFYGEVFKALNKAKVKYVVAGGIAVVMHGYSRLTKDLDLLVFLDKSNLDIFFETLKKIGYNPKVPVTKEQFIDEEQRKRWQKEKGMIVFSFMEKNPPYKSIDMFVDEPILFEKVYRGKIEAKINNLIVPLISIDHLRELKERAGRPQDIIDIIQLNAIKERIEDERETKKFKNRSKKNSHL